MDKWGTLRIIADEWLAKYVNSKNSYDGGKAKMAADFIAEMDDLDKRSSQED